MEILIIGGTRSIGPYIVRGLVQLGHAVTVFHRGEAENSLPGKVRHVHAPEAGIPVLSFPKELVDSKPDVVIHMIAMGEQDASAAVKAFPETRIVWISSGDVYRAYGVLTKIETSPPQVTPLTENSELRSVLYPYRAAAKSQDSLEYFYEKILVERIALSGPHNRGTVLRLPKVYGTGSNDDLATVYRYRHQPQWRWTHGFVENVASAIVLAAVNPKAAGRIFNVGEQNTPTVAERLMGLPPSDMPSTKQASSTSRKTSSTIRT